MDEISLKELKSTLKERIYWLKDYGLYFDENGKKLDLKPVSCPEVISVPTHFNMSDGKYLLCLKTHRELMTDSEIKSVFQISGDVRFNKWHEVQAHIIAAQFGPSSANAYLLGEPELSLEPMHVRYAVQYFEIIARRPYAEKAVAIAE
jgi:hypothetical protein